MARTTPQLTNVLTPYLNYVDPQQRRMAPTPPSSPQMDGPLMPSVQRVSSGRRAPLYPSIAGATTPVSSPMMTPSAPTVRGIGGYTYQPDRDAVFRNAAKAESLMAPNLQMGPPAPGKTAPMLPSGPGANAIALRDQFRNYDAQIQAPTLRAEADRGLVTAQTGLVNAQAEGARSNVAGTQRQNVDLNKQVADLTNRLTTREKESTTAYDGLRRQFDALQRQYADLASKLGAAQGEAAGLKNAPKTPAPAPQRQVQLNQPEMDASRKVGFGGVLAMRQGIEPGSPTTQPGYQPPQANQSAGGDDFGPSGEPEGSTAHNQSGQTIITRGGRWVPVR